MSQSSEKVKKSHKLVLIRAKKLKTSKKRDKLVKEKTEGSEKSHKMWQTSEKNWQVTEKKDKSDTLVKKCQKLV